MPKWGEHEAWITVDDKKVPEFEVKVEEPEPARAKEDPVVVSCWIPSELEKSFEVYCRPGILNNPGCDLYLDGQLIDKRYQDIAKDDPEVPFGFTGWETGPSTERPFIYSRIQTTDAEGLDIQNASDSLGTIALHTHELQLFGKEKENVVSREIPQPQLHNERAKKAIDHGVAFGAPINIQDTPTYTRRTKTTRKVVNFIFKYRPIEVLRANGIAPQVEEDPDVIEISDDEGPAEQEDEANILRERIAELERQSELARLRKRLAELERGTGRQPKRVKTEHVSVKTEAG